MAKKYTVVEIFFSPQGEGARAGLPHVFVRFAGCNKQCAIATHGFDCDTDFSAGAKLSARQIADEVDALAPDFHSPVLFTGGEPCLQLDDELVAAIDRHWVLETNGTVDPKLSYDAWELCDHVTISPKGPESELALPRLFEPHMNDNGNLVSGFGQTRMTIERRYVIAAGGEMPKPSHDADYYYLSPAFQVEEPGVSLNRQRPGALAYCIYLAKANPPWRVSVQQHKQWGVR